MGNSTSRVDEDKALVLCRERKRYVKYALDGRCCLADTHVNYVRSLQRVGIALGKFVEPTEAPVGSSMYTSTNATPEPPLLIGKSPSRFSFSTPSRSQRMDATDTVLPSPSPPSQGRFQANHMMFRGPFSKKVEEKLPVPVSGTITSSSLPHFTPVDQHGSYSNEAPAHVLETPPWDYFGLFHPIDDQFATQDGREDERSPENADVMHHYKEDVGTPELEGDRKHHPSHGVETSDDSEDEFDEPSADTLVRSFTNLNNAPNHVATPTSPAINSARSVDSQVEYINEEKKVTPPISPLTAASSARSLNRDSKKAPVSEKTDGGNKIDPKDFYSSIKDIEYLFVKASEAGQEVPRMLEANKLNFRPIVPGKEEEPAQNEVMYLTWHRTASSRSSSSRTPIGNASYPADIHCMNSGSHASTLDRLYAWERKLYDEVKASELVRSAYDAKCELLKHLQSRGTANTKIDKTRALVKDLYSRIGVAIERIESISKKIEEIRDNELQPQLEELIDGLTRMWEVMLQCHKLQYHIISNALSNGSNRISLQSESRRQITINLEDELTYLSSSFAKWIAAHKSYLKAIDGWLLKCVPPQKSSARRRKRAPPSIRNFGPPIYTTCGRWLERLDQLPTKEVADSIKGLAAETSRLLPKHEKSKGNNLGESSASLLNGSIDAASEDWVSAFDRFRSGLVGFLGQMNRYAEYSVEMYKDIDKAIAQVKALHQQHSNPQS
uniref:BZIP transcription factor n=1 Tax=Kalanchoe fedtschenkoi TaxID=63787 RepID=A0A7N0VJZ8_KALFE